MKYRVEEGVTANAEHRTSYEVRGLKWRRLQPDASQADRTSYEVRGLKCPLCECAVLSK